MLSTQLRPARSRISLYGFNSGGPLTGLKRAHFRSIYFTIFAALLAIGPRPMPMLAAAKRSGRPARVQTGLDILEAQKFAPLRGKPIGLITNTTALHSPHVSTVDALPP